MGQKLSETDRDLYRAVDEVLHYVWDPIGASAIPAARDEYHAYLPQVFRLVCEGSDAASIASYLGKVTTEQMGLAPRPTHDLHVAQVLLAWKEAVLAHRG